MTPRRGAAATMAPTSPELRGWITSATDGAVRPQPASCSRAIHAQGEQRSPRHEQNGDGPVAEEDVLRRATFAVLDREGVAEDGQGEGHDSDAEPHGAPG